VGANLAIAPHGLANYGSVSIDERSGRVRNVTGERVNWRRGCRRITGVHWALRRGRKGSGRARNAANRLRDGFFAHRTVMRAVTAAAGGQARVIAGSEAGRQRANPEEQDEEDGKHAPHLR